MITMRVIKNNNRYETQIIEFSIDDFLRFTREKDITVLTVFNKRYVRRKNALKYAKDIAGQMKSSLYDAERGFYVKTETGIEEKRKVLCPLTNIDVLNAVTASIVSKASQAV